LFAFSPTGFSLAVFLKWGGTPTLFARPWGFPTLNTASQNLAFLARFWEVLVKKPMLYYNRSTGENQYLTVIFKKNDC
jgi:hypothetical protein